LENRIIELETKVAFQDDTILKLEAQLAGVEQTLLRLTKELDALRTQVASGEGNGVMPLADEAPPPHY
jgi:SlyX protein